MAQYIVKSNQNLFDVALHIYGTIEGIFDLLITNPDINMTSELKTGSVIEYHENFVIYPSIVNTMNDEGWVPSNGERHVYNKHQEYLPVFIILAQNDATHISFKAGGDGAMFVDWGDNSELETINLTHVNKTCEHYYDNYSDVRRVKIYGRDFTLTYLDTTNITGDLVVLSPVCVDEYVNNSNGFNQKGLFLFEGTYSVNLQKCYITDLLPIGDLDLMTLDLRGARFVNIDVLDDYLEYIVANYANRRACTVYLTTQPSERGMVAINTIINEEAWNTPGKWKFIINDITYTAS